MGPHPEQKYALTEVQVQWTLRQRLFAGRTWLLLLLQASAAVRLPCLVCLMQQEAEVLE